VNVGGGPVSAWSFDHDANGNLQDKTDALGDQWIYGYDQLNRLTSVSSFPNGIRDMTTHGVDTNCLQT
jgi:YD repeat-containing protein